MQFCCPLTCCNLLHEGSSAPAEQHALHETWACGPHQDSQCCHNAASVLKAVTDSLASMPPAGSCVREACLAPCPARVCKLLMRFICDNGCHKVIPAERDCKGRAADLLLALPWQCGLFLGQLLSHMISASTAELCTVAHADTLGPRQHAGAAFGFVGVLCDCWLLPVRCSLQDKGCPPCDINGCICLYSASLGLQTVSHHGAWVVQMHTSSNWSSALCSDIHRCQSPVIPTLLLPTDLAGFDTSRGSLLETSKRVRLALVSCTPEQPLKPQVHQHRVYSQTIMIATRKLLPCEQSELAIQRQASILPGVVIPAQPASRQEDGKAPAAQGRSGWHTQSTRL